MNQKTSKSDLKEAGAMVIRIFLSVLLWVSADVAATGEVHHFKPAKGYLTYAVREPLLRINPGDAVVTNTPSKEMGRSSA